MATMTTPIPTARAAPSEAHATRIGPVLLATHGGASADGAARIAIQLAARGGVPLEAVTAMEPLALADSGYGPIVPPMETDEAVVAALREAAQVQLRRCGAPAECTHQLQHGGAPWVIASLAQRDHASVIVLGLGSHRVVDRMMGGETALLLVQVASTPVLAVPAATTAVPRRVLAAVDFTPSSLRAATLAASWLAPQDELILAHVVPEGTVGAGAEARLMAFRNALTIAPTVAVEWTVLAGDPARALLAYADKRDCDLIALGSHGYGFWKRLTIGSVASKIMRLTTRSVLVVPLASVAAPR